MENSGIRQVPIADYDYHQEAIKALAVSTDEKYVASGADDGNICIVDLRCENVVKYFDITGDSNRGYPIVALSWSPDCRSLVACTVDGSVSQVRWRTKDYVSFVAVF